MTFTAADANSQTTAPKMPARKPMPRTGQEAERTRIILLREVGGERTTSNDPETAAVGEIDDRQRRQHSDEEAAEQYRLGQS